MAAPGSPLYNFERDKEQIMHDYRSILHIVGIRNYDRTGVGTWDLSPTDWKQEASRK